MAKVRSELKSGENKIQTWVQELLTEELQRLTSGKLQQTLTASAIEEQYGTRLASLEQRLEEQRQMLQKQLDTNVRLTTLVERLGDRIEVLEAMDEGIEGHEGLVPPEGTSEITAEGSTLPQSESSTWTPPVVESTPVQAFGSPLPSPEFSTISMGPTQGLMSTLPIGQLKLEAPPRFNGARRPGAQKWLESMTTWMTLMNYPRD